MKKIISIILTILTLFSLTATTASAKTETKAVKKDPKTYVSEFTSAIRYRYYEFSKGKITYDRGNENYRENYTLFYTDLKGERYTIEEHVIDKSVRVEEFYARIDKVYYSKSIPIDEEDEYGAYVGRYKYQIISSDLTGKNKKVLFTAKHDEDFRLIGGYGSSVIFKSKNQVYKWYKGKVTKLFKTKSNEIVKIFNGKIYDCKIAYNLKTNKSKKFVAKQMDVTKKYLYYINKNDNLKRLDRQGNRETVDSKGKIGKIWRVNDGQTVIYSKGTGDKETFYRRTGLKKVPVRLASITELVNKLTFEKEQDTSYKKINDIVLHDYKVYFSITVGKFLSYSGEYPVYTNDVISLVSVGVNGNNMTQHFIDKLHFEDSDYYHEVDSFALSKVGEKLRVTAVYKLDEDHTEYKNYYF